MREHIDNLKKELQDVDVKLEELDKLRDSLMCDEHYDVVSKQFGYLSDYSEVLGERIAFEEEYFKAIGLLK